MDEITLLSALLGVVLALLLHQALPPIVILIGGMAERVRDAGGWP
ncbi:MAG: hypothetical protein AAF959_02135 [Cyanobacteria bacterium P01_D01_bin.56]